jgi:hypothetical protein
MIQNEAERLKEQFAKATAAIEKRKARRERLFLVHPHRPEPPRDTETVDFVEGWLKGLAFTSKIGSNDWSIIVFPDVPNTQ